MSSTDVKLGTILGTFEQRDAVHIAIAPVKAAKNLKPGQHIGFDQKGEATDKSKYDKFQLIGIVDPLLPCAVAKGQRFYMWLYPQTVTSLRHAWTHPSFDAEPVQLEVVGPKEEDNAIVESKAWIKKFADSIHQSYDDLMLAAQKWVLCEHYTYDNSERYKDHWEKFPEFWDHYEIVTGERVKNKGSFFTCSC